MTDAHRPPQRTVGIERWNDWHQRMALRTRVSMLAAICVGAAVALVSLGAYLAVHKSLYDELDRSLTQRATQAVGESMAASQLRSAPAVVLVASDVQLGLVYASGEVLSAGTRAPATGRAELAVARGELPRSLRTDTATDTRVIALPIGTGAALVVAQPLDSIRGTLGLLSVVLAVVGGAGIVVAAIAGTAVARAALKPVERLTAATERVATTGDLRPIVVSGDDELARMTMSFNTMLGAVAESQERQRRLVADAGHELRTPLTSLRTNLELLVASSKPDAPQLSPQDRMEIYEDVRAQINELSNLVGDLVELAREDAPQVVHEPVELVDVVERALDRARRRAPGIAFEVRPHPWTLLGDANALERAVLNLLDNAAKWSPPEGTVLLTMTPENDTTIRVEVADSGPGIAPADLPHVFERFYRSPEARTLPGSGLGLAIVSQAAERHGGTVRAGRADTGGALLTLRLPGRAGV
ncbi:sensor histidine kinase [Actinoalloteichus sp. AHMU CJ021]|uniref:histidine kinase n=2 Tax=Pseudonocardiaceae TaxID=2070 RepID=A0ABT1JL70_ACTCY|nr:sensor histidine kinase [Actinoalloteichus sp. AHMU CJ021]MCP2332486.1 two-component system, OmpR family, sensor histidine kinase MprB [Actinoalloteichus caeruleus DSM 43889]